MFVATFGTHYIPKKKVKENKWQKYYLIS
jgi:hypothetical protein